MATLAVTFAFAADAQSFTGNAGAASVLQWIGTDGNPAGCLSNRITGKSKSNSNSWTRSLTYETMGVPAGSTITGITAGSMQSKCTEFTTGASSTSGAVTLVDGVTTVTLSSARTGIVATDASWVTTNGVDSTGLSKASSNSVTITINDTLATGSSSSAAVTVLQDQLTYTLTYTPPVATINATKGPYTYAGKASGLEAFIGAKVGAYTYAGLSSKLTTIIPASVGAYAYAGKPSVLSAMVGAGVGAYNYLGNASVLTSLLPASIGTYSYAGPAATVTGGSTPAAQIYAGFMSFDPRVTKEDEEKRLAYFAREREKSAQLRAVLTGAYDVLFAEEMPSESRQREEEIAKIEADPAASVNVLRKYRRAMKREYRDEALAAEVLKIERAMQIVRERREREQAETDTVLMGMMMT